MSKSVFDLTIEYLEPIVEQGLMAMVTYVEDKCEPMLPRDIVSGISWTVIHNVAIKKILENMKPEGEA